MHTCQFISATMFIFDTLYMERLKRMIIGIKN